MEFIDLNEEQVENIETRQSLFDRNYISYKMNVFAIMKMQKINYSEHFFVKRID